MSGAPWRDATLSWLQPNDLIGDARNYYARARQREAIDRDPKACPDHRFKAEWLDGGKPILVKLTRPDGGGTIVEAFDLKRDKR